MNDFKRKKQDFPSNNRMKQIEFGWIARIDILWELISIGKNLEGKKFDLFLKSLDIVKELKGPPLVREATLLTKE